MNVDAEAIYIVDDDPAVRDALSVLFWFNLPLIWIERSLTHAREIACDAESLEALGGAERKPYAGITRCGARRNGPRHSDTKATVSASGWRAIRCAQRRLATRNARLMASFSWAS